jgi:hypothetical protein
VHTSSPCRRFARNIYTLVAIDLQDLSVEFRFFSHFKVEVGDTYQVLCVCVANGTLNINIISVYPGDAPITNTSRLNKAGLEVLITVLTPDSGGDVTRHINRYVSDEHPTCETPRGTGLVGRINTTHTSLPDHLC